ncbi:MAG: 2-oxoacid:acceptor oxidoreductase family protein, partial [Paludibacteraceae bacterium]|nr:2-oxoacid:acceptor oxidoreductase family protein [Paludibacteraceae bacterium]
MNTNIILSGVGGQGILSIAAVIGKAALNNDLYIKQSEVHGMSQRGGD